MMNYIRDVDLQPGNENIFDIQDPIEATCVVKRYASGHPVMWITLYEAGQQNPSDHIVIRGLAFFDGTLSWKGANFCVASTEECQSLVNELGWIKGASPDEATDFLDQLHLITVNSPNYRIRMLATGASISQDIPEFVA